MMKVKAVANNIQFVSNNFISYLLYDANLSIILFRRILIIKVLNYSNQSSKIYYKFGSSYSSYAPHHR